MGNNKFRAFLRAHCSHVFKSFPITDLSYKRCSDDATGWIWKVWSIACERAVNKREGIIEDHKIYNHIVFSAYYLIKDMLTNRILPIMIFDGFSDSKNKDKVRISRSNKRKKQANEIAKLKEEAENDPKQRVKYLTKLRYTRALNKTAYEFIPALFRAMGVPVVKARGEAEALASRLQTHGIVDYVRSEDIDVLCHGASFVIEGFDKEVDGVKYMKGYYIKDVLDALAEYVHVEFDLPKRFTYKQLQQFYYLLGCDYNQDEEGKGGISGLGGVRAIELIALYGSIENIPLSEFAKYKGFNGIEDLNIPGCEEEFNRPIEDLIGDDVDIQYNEITSSDLNNWMKPNQIVDIQSLITEFKAECPDWFTSVENNTTISNVEVEALEDIDPDDMLNE